MEIGTGMAGFGEILMTQASHMATVFIVAATPISELRGAIPLGVFVFGLPIWFVVLVAIAGNLVPVVLIYGLGNAWLGWTERRKGFFKRCTDRVVGRAERKFADKYMKYGMVALPIFVGIPLPMTGAWTGTLAAFLLGIPFRKAFPLASAGIVIAAVIVTLATTGVVSFLGFVTV